MGPVTKLALFYHLPFDHSNYEAKDVQRSRNAGSALGMQAPPSELECGSRDGPLHSSTRWDTGPTVRLPRADAKEPTLLQG